MVGRRSAGPTLQKVTASERTTTTSVERSLLRIEDITADNQLDQIAQPIILLSEAVGEARTQVGCAKLSLADTFSASGVFHPALDVRCPHEFVLLVSEVGLLALLHLF